MAINITTATATPVGRHDAICITVNLGFTGTLAVTSAGSNIVPASTIATITNPATGNSFNYNGLRGAGELTVTPSAPCDVTVSSQVR